MEEMKIRLTKADDVREFVRAARKCEFDVDISYERAVVDGKSIIGNFCFGSGSPADCKLPWRKSGISAEHAEVCGGSIKERFVL
ncbi:HPr family phosphocarrier protein [Blautia argi]|uniref:HPr family phosphocarrier protein n=1 Tax=Blautia argi TaxID=1912897 RepID=UPI001FA8375D|nr:HPr family phosphocarrier protein [Blautia argi]